MKFPSSIFIATFSVWRDGKRTASNGIMDPMMYFFAPRTNKLIILDQPYPGSDRVKPIVETHIKGELKNKNITGFTNFLLSSLLNSANKPGTHMVFKLRDFLSVIEAGLNNSGKIDLFIGLESVNALGGVVLKKFGKVKRVVYYVSDYSPNRFQNKILNSIYLWLDKIAATNSDYIWDVSLAMHPARINAGLNPNQSATSIHVPNALYKEQISTIPINKREPNSCVFVGTLGLENGPDIAIKAMRHVVKKYPKAKLHILGGGGKGFEEKYLKKLTIKYQLTRNIEFHGFISDQNKLSSMIKHYQVALAPYKKIPGSIRYYGDATKIRLYMASGIPLITTDVPPLGHEVKKARAAIITNDNEKSFAESIIYLLSSPDEANKLAKNAYKFAKNNLWEKSYKNAIKKMGYE